MIEEKLFLPKQEIRERSFCTSTIGITQEIFVTHIKLSKQFSHSLYRQKPKKINNGAESWDFKYYAATMMLFSTSFTMYTPMSTMTQYQSLIKSYHS